MRYGKKSGIGFFNDVCDLPALSQGGFISGNAGYIKFCPDLQISAAAHDMNRKKKTYMEHKGLS